MKQFIRYLYEYEHGKRIRNVGFVKGEKLEEKCTIHIYGKGMESGNGKKLEVFVFYVQDGQCIGISQGKIEGNSPVISYILKFGVEDIGEIREFEAVEGIILQSSSGRKYAAMWTDEPVNVENMRTREENVEKPEEIVEEDEFEEEYKEEYEETRTRESLIEHVEKLVAEEVDSYIPPSTRTYEKIQRQDISRLPRREWKLANNSFLLHGFYNYHHLLYIEEDGNRWLGVPGIYHEKERTAARAFGFPQFHRITDTDLELSAEEKNTYDDFGYWCRQVEGQ